MAISSNSPARVSAFSGEEMPPGDISSCRYFWKRYFNRKYYY
ncbi:hypothetical protein [Candidatus Ichthyocystis sparus]|nr:hypothetical protein [Candidatus Ichthyocystis sparus]